MDCKNRRHRQQSQETEWGREGQHGSGTGLAGCPSLRFGFAPQALHTLPDREEIAECREQIAEHAHFRLGRIFPLDRDTLDPEIECIGDREDLDVENESVDLLPLENGTDHPLAECLEAALGIGKFRQTQESDHAVELLPGKLPGPALSHRDLGTRVGAVAYNHVEIGIGFEHLQKLIEMTQGRAEVGIHEKDDLARRLEHSPPDSMPFPSLLLPGEHADGRIRGGKFLGESHGPVATTFDRREDFDCEIRMGALPLGERFQRATETPGFVVGRNYDRERWKPATTHGNLPARMESRTVARRFDWGVLLIILVAAVLRLALLDYKPAHFDEGVNGWFVDQMSRYGYFRYDPDNYHGPLHFYALFASQQLLGRNLWALRLVTVAVSLASIWLTLRFAPLIGKRASRIAALCMAVSPAFTFYSRYAIHEAWVVLFLILMAWGILGLAKFGNTKYLIGLVAGVTGMILTKETYVIHFACFLLAGITLWLWEWVFPSSGSLPLHKPRWQTRHLAWSVGGGLAAIVFFYSGNLLAWDSLQGLWQTHATWFNTGVHAAGHDKPTFDLFGIGPWQLNAYWVYLGARYEWPFLLGLLACFRYIFPSRAPIRYLAIYGAGTLVAYSLIPYKTPWISIAIFWPFYFVLGALVEEWRKLLWPLAVTLIAVAVSLSMAIRLNFFHPTDHSEPYVYVQTDEEIVLFTEPILDAARKDPTKYQLRGQILLNSYYPLPWMFGDFVNVGYFKEDSWPDRLDGDFIVTEKSKEADVRDRLDGEYVSRRFLLRDAQEECIAFFRKEVFPNLAGRE